MGANWNTLANGLRLPDGSRPLTRECVCSEDGACGGCWKDGAAFEHDEACVCKNTGYVPIAPDLNAALKALMKAGWEVTIEPDTDEEYRPTGLFCLMVWDKERGKQGLSTLAGGSKSADPLTALEIAACRALGLEVTP